MKFIITLNGEQLNGPLRNIASAQTRLNQYIDSGMTGEFEVIELNPAIFYDGCVIESVFV